MFDSFDFIDALLRYFALLVTILGCAIVYAYVAYRYAQDCVDTSSISGAKISFNPSRYFDPIGSGLFPAIMILLQAPIMFGWSKNIFVDYSRVISSYGFNSAILLESSGIFFHFFIAFLSSLFLDISPNSQITSFLQYIILFNIFFAFIKLCPILPYEGLRILSYIGLKFQSDLFARLYSFLAPYQIFVLLIVFFTPLNNLILYPALFVIGFLL
ncbi:hypothetical protein CQA62_01795 [Helicobacter cholecystus]|uniref:Uncharacterized protein n=1 Tax=Helicobacter cholecystus TaxID=45498 RepID=A0A3D8IY29_9HELI|nr:hypothetical protein [Helicobacter cholecystus]RDU70168.1 hypothetical protein CQA62_01795 [Helicobacter cholecystus]VEJ24652.1 membrane-associated metallopeptidase [Helicobacter cholecystus]